LLLLTGNNIRILRDLARRVLVARLDTKLESPFGRRFAFNPETMVREDRIGYVCAALTLIRAAIMHGDTFDKQGLGTPFDNSSTASYDDWDRLIRQTVGWVVLSLEGPVTFGDPTAGIIDTASSDPRKDTLRSILIAWHDCFGSDWRTCLDAWTYAKEGSFSDDKDREIRRTALRDAFDELDDDDRRKFDYKNIARWLTTKRDQVVDGLRFECQKTRDNKNQWRVVEIA
jgi:hypothetical protein